MLESVKTQSPRAFSPGSCSSNPVTAPRGLSHIALPRPPLSECLTRTTCSARGRGRVDPVLPIKLRCTDLLPSSVAYQYRFTGNAKLRYEFFS